MFQNIGADRKNYHKLKTFTNSLEQKNSREVRKIGYTRRVPQKIFGTVRQNCDPPPHPNKIFGTLKTLNFKMVSFCKVDPRCGFNLVQCIYNGNFYSKTLLFNWYCSFNLGYFGNWVFYFGVGYFGFRVFWPWLFWDFGVEPLNIYGRQDWVCLDGYLLWSPRKHASTMSSSPSPDIPVFKNGLSKCHNFLETYNLVFQPKTYIFINVKHQIQRRKLLLALGSSLSHALYLRHLRQNSSILATKFTLWSWLFSAIGGDNAVLMKITVIKFKSQQKLYRINSGSMSDV